MAYLTFLIRDAYYRNVQGFALGAYHPFYVKGTKERNPAFDKNSKNVLDLKTPGKPWFAPAVTYCTIHLAHFLKSQVNAERAEFLIVPSSTEGKISSGLETVVQNVCRSDKRFTYRSGSLVRTKTIAKRATGGDRSLDVQLASLEYAHDTSSPRLKILLDDVMTSGNSLSGAMMVVQQYDQGATFIPVVLGRTTHD